MLMGSDAQWTECFGLIVVSQRHRCPNIVGSFTAKQGTQKYRALRMANPHLQDVFLLSLWAPLWVSGRPLSDIAAVIVSQCH